MKKIRDIFSGNEGFTLIELLIVIVIIGVLAAIAVPNIAGLGDSAEEEAVRANMRTLMIELESFKVQNGGKFDNSGTEQTDITGYSSFADFVSTSAGGNKFTFSGAQALDDQIETSGNENVNITSNSYTIEFPSSNFDNIVISDGQLTTSTD